MRPLLWCVSLGVIVAGWTAAGAAQTPAPAQNLVSSGAKSRDVTDSIELAPEDTDAAIDPASLLPDLPSLPPAKATLIGGTIQKLDRVQDEMTVRAFGGGKVKISFDPRTRIDLGKALGSPGDLHQGDRVYVDTILDGSTVFAKNIRLRNAVEPGVSQGIVSSYRADRGELVLRDALSPRPMKLRLTSQTEIVHGGRAASAGQLVPGTLVSIQFGPQQDGVDVARQVSILAVPGGHFTFTGRVTGLDLRLGLLVITSSTDNKTYEIYFDPALIQPDETLHESAQVTVLTRFDGNHYVARNMTVIPSNQQ
ncbi:MAG: DUF5666 domain-containing protein [Candidatus Sulfotelmatobacter sp.]